MLRHAHELAVWNASGMPDHDSPMDIGVETAPRNRDVAVGWWYRIPDTNGFVPQSGERAVIHPDVARARGDFDTVRRIGVVTLGNIEVLHDDVPITMNPKTVSGNRDR